MGKKNEKHQRKHIDWWPVWFHFVLMHHQKEFLHCRMLIVFFACTHSWIEGDRGDFPQTNLEVRFETVRRFMTFVKHRRLIGCVRLESCNHDSTSFIFITIPWNSCLTTWKRCVGHKNVFMISCFTFVKRFGSNLLHDSHLPAFTFHPLATKIHALLQEVNKKAKCFFPVPCFFTRTNAAVVADHICLDSCTRKKELRPHTSRVEAFATVMRLILHLMLVGTSKNRFQCILQYFQKYINEII